jgi:hypothetical protein
MSVKSIIEAAMLNARRTAGGSEKNAAAPGDDLVKLAHQLADANEFIALSAADDGTPEGQVRRSVVEQFFKGAGGEKIPGPAQSESPTGTQAVPPQSGAKKILPLGLASGNSPTESVAPTGTQATLDQTGTKKAGMTLLDMLTKNADGPAQSVAGENSAAPPTKNENSNIEALRSAAGMVALTKREAKLPTRERLKALFAHAGDTGPSSAAAQAAFPNAYAKGGMKVAAIAFTDAGHKLEAERGRAAEESHGRISRAGNAYDKEQPLMAALLGTGARGVFDGPAQTLAARHGAYKARQHDDKRQSLNPFGGFRTKTEAEKKGGIAFTDAGHKLEAERGRASEYRHGRIARAGTKYDKEQPLTAALLGTGARGVFDGPAQTLAARHGAYVARKHDDKRQALNPFGGFLTKTTAERDEKKASLFDYAKLAELAESGALGDEALTLIQFAESLPV